MANKINKINKIKILWSKISHKVIYHKLANIRYSNNK
jgi:hypothetical protein